MIDKTGTKGIFVECKYTNSKMPHKEYEDSVIRHAKEDGAVLLGVDALFEDSGTFTIASKVIGK